MNEGMKEGRMKIRIIMVFIRYQYYLGMECLVVLHGISTLKGLLAVHAYKAGSIKRDTIN